MYVAGDFCTKLANFLMFLEGPFASIGKFDVHFCAFNMPQSSALFLENLAETLAKSESLDTYCMLSL